MKNKNLDVDKILLLFILLTVSNFSVLSQSFLSSPTRFEDSSLGKEAAAADWEIFFEKNYPFFSMEWNSDSIGCLGKRYNYVGNKSFLLSILGIKKEHFLIFFGTPNFKFQDPIFNSNGDELHYLTSGICGKNSYTPLGRYVFFF